MEKELEEERELPYQPFGKVEDRKLIRCVWIGETGMYGSRLHVVYSNHPDYVVGSRFDWGFASVATQRDGYEVQIAGASTEDGRGGYKGK